MYLVVSLYIQESSVKTDYGPLLHTLAEFGWLLTCVLPTPIIRHDRWASTLPVAVVMLSLIPSALHRYVNGPSVFVCVATGTWQPSRWCFCRGPSGVKQRDNRRTR